MRSSLKLSSMRSYSFKADFTIFAISSGCVSPCVIEARSTIALLKLRTNASVSILLLLSKACNFGRLFSSVGDWASLVCVDLWMQTLGFGHLCSKMCRRTVRLATLNVRLATLNAA